jgi:HAD superfamily hydrolase (TIGR01509 family)
MAGHVQAVVFDLDGVLIDSEQLWDVVRRGLADEASRPWPAEATRAMQGMSTAEWSTYLTDVVGVPGKPEDVAVTVIDRMAARYDAQLPLLPGAVEVVERLARRWRLGLASSSPRRLIDTVLAATGLVQQFQVSVSTEEVPAGKPSPAVYQTVVQRLGVDPSRAVAIEDSSNGLRSAAAAGLSVLAVPHPAFPPSADALALADVVVNSLDEITPELVASMGRRVRDRGMISIDDFLYYVDDALDGMVRIVCELGDDLANRRPDLPGANSPFAILTHCLGVMEYWGGEIVAGRHIVRDRPAEFRATGRVAALTDDTQRARRRLRADLAALDPFAPPRGDPHVDDATLPLARTQGGALLHIYEELAQHRGQLEITRDLLRTPWAQFR